MSRRNRACAAYDEARQAFADFDKKALLWADVSNKISKSASEKELISEVISPVSFSGIHPILGRGFGIKAGGHFGCIRFFP